MEILNSKVCGGPTKCEKLFYLTNRLAHVLLQYKIVFVFAGALKNNKYLLNHLGPDNFLQFLTLFERTLNQK